MPIFEYRCKKCGHITEFLENQSYPRKHVCEKCKSSDLQKLFSGFSVGQSNKSSPRGNETCPTGTCGLT